jgi:hypothetical protein
MAFGPVEGPEFPLIPGREKHLGGLVEIENFRTDGEESIVDTGVVRHCGSCVVGDLPVGVRGQTDRTGRGETLAKSPFDMEVITGPDVDPLFLATELSR